MIQFGDKINEEMKRKAGEDDVRNIRMIERKSERRR
jgi:hypothetical protein